jgi:hypothetical protein
VILSRRVGVCSEGVASESWEIFSAMDLSFSASSEASRSSSEVTLDWILSSRLADLVVSDLDVLSVLQRDIRRHGKGCLPEYYPAETL